MFFLGGLRSRSSDQRTFSGSLWTSACSECNKCAQVERSGCGLQPSHFNARVVQRGPPCQPGVVGTRPCHKDLHLQHAQGSTASRQHSPRRLYTQAYYGTHGKPHFANLKKYSHERSSIILKFTLTYKYYEYNITDMLISLTVQGVRVFAVEWTLHILVTGSSDGRLRVWNPYVPEAALVVLPPSPAPPAAILICPHRRVIITCDADAVSSSGITFSCESSMSDVMIHVCYCTRIPH